MAIIKGTTGNDTLYGTAGADEMRGLAGNDHLFGRGGDDQIFGAQGRDELFGEAGNDRLWGQSGNDSLVGQAGDDRIYGGEGSDAAWGGDGRDGIFGELGNDRLHGGAGNDIIDGAGGQDLLEGNAGDDVLRGGADADQFVYGGVNEGHDHIEDFATGIDFSSVDFSQSFNRSLERPLMPHPYPTGDLLLGGGVPFHIPTTGNNEWGSGDGRGGGAGNEGQWVLDVDVDRFGVDNVYTLINTDWGTSERGFMFIEFFGSDGAYYKKELVGDTDTRDWNLGYADQINGTTTVNVVTIPDGRDGSPDVMDMQIFDLPSDFLDETLTEIKVTDNREVFVHSGLVSGITAAMFDGAHDTLVFGSGAHPTDVRVQADANGDAVIAWSTDGRANSTTLDDVGVAELRAAWDEVVVGVPASQVDFVWAG